MKTDAVIMVDDEAEILESSLYATIRQHLPGVECIPCKTTTEARDLVDYLDADGRAVPLFIVDEVMKGSPETGTDLIAHFDQTHPKARKILLSGQATTEAVVRALNQAGADKYVEKRLVAENQGPILEAIDTLLFQYRREKEVVFTVKDADGSPIVVRAAETSYDIHQACKLVYLVYEELEKRFRDGVLTPEQIHEREKWDRFDFTGDGRIVPSTKHFVAMKDGACIACARLWLDVGPLDTFDFGTGDRPTLRAGKWMVHPDYRTSLLPIDFNIEDSLHIRSPIALPLLMHCFISARHEYREDEIYLTCLPKLKQLYSKVGFRQVGEPFDHTTLRGDEDGEHPGKYIGMVVNVDDTVTEYNLVCNGSKDKSESALSLSILGCILAPLQSSRIGDFITECRTPWLRYE
jgi:two-component system chemotaxis response regulator CheY